MSEHRESRAFRLKMQLAFAVWKRGDLSPAMRLVFTVLLIGHHNAGTGKCNPSYETLASECGMTRHGVIRIIGKLEAKGLLAVSVSVGRKHTNSFRFPLLEMVAGGPPIKGSEMVAGRREMVARQPRNGGRSATQNIKEHKEHSEASPLPRNSAASASQKKRNGQQSEADEKRERDANLVKLEDTAACLKAMGIEPSPKPPPRVNGPTRYKATEADSNCSPGSCAKGEPVTGGKHRHHRLS